MTATTPSTRTRAAYMLRAAASDEDTGNGARLHCLYAADLLDPHAGMPATGTRTDSPTLVPAALRLLAALPTEQFTDQVRAATVHARQALRELGTPDRHVTG
jgi:hypothetical protein